MLGELTHLAGDFYIQTLRAGGENILQAEKSGTQRKLR